MIVNTAGKRPCYETSESVLGMLLAISSRVSPEGHHTPQCLHLAKLDSSQRSPSRGLTRRGLFHQTEQRPSSDTRLPRTVFNCNSQQEPIQNLPPNCVCCPPPFRILFSGRGNNNVDNLD
ncbi:hypothetical protein TNCV_3105181 [Trichonephila clavipes]|nr:hypothetical protein TNCV_3105181 [Trichonephila clavipes]